MYWLDGFTFDDNLINNSFLSADSNGELSDNNHRLSKASSSTGNATTKFRSSNRKAQNLKGLAATTKAKRRRHAHYKLNTRLDRKSSRGMIYENEELRLRTININAEVERGQTDIKRLRKENEHLRREIWTLRDECDRLNKRVKAKFIEHEQGVYSVRCNGGNSCSCQYNDGGGGCEGIQCGCNSEDSDSCGSCCCQEEDINPCNEECCNENKNVTDISEGDKASVAFAHNEHPVVAAAETPATVVSKLANFDHLSVVSEETLSNSEVVLAQQSENLLGYTPDLSGSQTTLPSLVGPLTPLTPIDLVANELNDLQAVVPPLSYFENILQEHMCSNYGSTPESSSTTNSGKTIVKHTNGWDYKLESPFAQRQYHANSISPIMTKRLPAQILTTFVPTSSMTSPSCTNIVASSKNLSLPKNPPTDLSVNCQQHPMIETVPILILPPNSCGPQGPAAMSINDNSGNSTPKHFFAPIKPKLKLNTALANQKRIPPSLSSVSEPASEEQSLAQQHKCEPPDIYVTNGLATPYRPPSKPMVQPPPIPQRITSTSTMQAQVSSTQHQRNRHQQPHHHKQHQMRRYQHQQHNNVFVTNNDVYVMPVIYTTTTSITATTTKTITTVAILKCTNNLCTSMKTNLKTFSPLLTTETDTVLTSNNTKCNSVNPLLKTPITETTIPSSAATTFSMAYLTSTTCPTACFKFLNSNINFRRPNDPVYAIAQNVCHNLITATAVTQPLMSSIVKCCIAKQQQLQLQQHQYITAESSLSATKSYCTTTAADDVGRGAVVMTSLPLAQTIASSFSSPSLSMTELSSISCNLTKNSSLKYPITAATTSTSFIVVDSMCQTDSANLESILNDIEAISEDILSIQLVKNKSRENIIKSSTDSITKIEQSPLQQDNKNSKPYRSEMNLLLTYEGDITTIKQADTTANTVNNITSESTNNTNTARRTRSLERDHADSPSPHIPDPMQPFPENRKYIGFDRVNKAAVVATTTTPLVAATATQTLPILNSPLSQRSQLPLSPLVTNVNTPKSINGKQLPPTPPTRSYPIPLNIKCAGIARSSSVAGCLPTTDSSTNSPGFSGVSPNKSQLYAALANAAAKRAQFRSQPTHLTKSLDTECNLPDTTNEDDKNVVRDEKEALEKLKRKARRVSIVCADTDSPGSPENPPPAVRNQIGFHTTATGSCTDLHAAMPNPAIRNFKQTSQSTPNSPHSSRKHDNSPLAVTPVPPIISITPNSTPQHQWNSPNANGMSILLAHNHAHSYSYPNVISPLTQEQKMRKNSQDTIKASAAEIACAAANVMRSKCSRRHSDSTVSHVNQRISGVSGATNGSHHHHPHNHHHRQHSSSLASNTNPHQSHHSRRDSNHETMASLSDRNSNSLASSRESSASFSMRSQRRKLSVSSHTGGKIPWCGCWGNGCL